MVTIASGVGGVYPRYPHVSLNHGYPVSGGRGGPRMLGQRAGGIYSSHEFGAFAPTKKAHRTVFRDHFSPFRGSTLDAAIMYGHLGGFSL